MNKNDSKNWLFSRYGLDRNVEYDDIFIKKLIHSLNSDARLAINQNKNLVVPTNWSNSGISLLLLFLSNKVKELLYNYLEKDDITHSEFLQYLTDLSAEKVLNSQDEELLDNMKGSVISDFSFRILCFAHDDRTYSVRSNVIRLLSETRVDESVPCDMVHAPDRGVVYIEFGQEKPSLDLVMNIKLDEHVATKELVDGFYVDEVEQDTADICLYPKGGEDRIDGYQLLKELDLPKTDKIRVLGMNFIGSVQSNLEDPLNVGCKNFEFFIPVYGNNEYVSFLDLVERHIQRWEMLDIEREPDDIELVKFACLVLMYISSTDYRCSVSSFDEAKTKIESAGNKKKPKRIKQAMRQSNRIYISPVDDGEISNGGESQSESKRTVKTHYRKGFLKMQPHGKERSRRKIIWVKPTIVNPNVSVPESKEYVVM